MSRPKCSSWRSASSRPIDGNYGLFITSVSLLKHCHSRQDSPLINRLTSIQGGELMERSRERGGKTNKINFSSWLAGNYVPLIYRSCFYSVVAAAAAFIVSNIIATSARKSKKHKQKRNNLKPSQLRAERFQLTVFRASRRMTISLSFVHGICRPRMVVL